MSLEITTRIWMLITLLTRNHYKKVKEIIRNLNFFQNGCLHIFCMRNQTFQQHQNDFFLMQLYHNRCSSVPVTSFTFQKFEVFFKILPHSPLQCIYIEIVLGRKCDLVMQTIRTHPCTQLLFFYGNLYRGQLAKKMEPLQFIFPISSSFFPR